MGLDVIRFLAVLLVLGSHLRMPDASPGWIAAWNQGGWVGVELFFVLSGFLVSSILFREHQKTGSIRFRRFLVRRGLKIYPAFWLMMGTTLAFALVSRSPIEPNRIWGEVLFVQNYLGSVWPHTWSLAVEEHFYLGLVVLFWYLTQRSRSTPFDSLPFVFLVITGLCHLFRIVDPYWMQDSVNARRGFWTHHRIDSLFFGVLIAYLVLYRSLNEKLRGIPSWALLGTGSVCLSHAFFRRDSSLGGIG